MVLFHFHCELLSVLSFKNLILVGKVETYMWLFATYLHTSAVQLFVCVCMFKLNKYIYPVNK